MSVLEATRTRPAHDSELARAVSTFVLEGYAPPGPDTRRAFESEPRWRALHDTGTALWLDTGDIEGIRKVWALEFTALTTNNTLLNKEVQKGIYDDVVARAAQVIRQVEPQAPEHLLVTETAFILNVLHGLKLVRSFDADVSVELHTDLARDVEGSYRYGKRIHAINPERFIVKVPLSPEGLLAARKLSRDGIRVNFTLGFSARQNRLIAEVSRPAFVNVFLGRLNSFVADNKLGDGKNVGEKATLASQRVMRIASRELKTKVRQIAASIRGGQQVFDLAGVDVQTIPLAAAEEYVKLDLPPESARDRTAEDPEVAFASGFDHRKERIDAFWEVGDDFLAALRSLARIDLDSMSGDGLRRFLAGKGLADVFPVFVAGEAARLASDGKIPVYEHWKERVRAGSASWDGILTEAALASFAADQKKLDDRVRGLLARSA